MKKEKNGMAIAGFVLCVSAVPMLVAGFLCLIRVMLTAFVGVVFGEAAGLTAIFGIALSGIGHHRSYRENMGGGGLALAGLLSGTVVVTLTLAVAAALIVGWAAGGINPLL